MAAVAIEIVYVDQMMKNIIFIELLCLEKFDHKESEST